MPLMGINRQNSAKCVLSTTENRTTITISLVYLLRNFSIGFESLTEWFSLSTCLLLLLLFWFLFLFGVCLLFICLGISDSSVYDIKLEAFASLSRARIHFQYKTSTTKYPKKLYRDHCYHVKCTILYYTDLNFQLGNVELRANKSFNRDSFVLLNSIHILTYFTLL